jgi:hypothetical protein
VGPATVGTAAGGTGRLARARTAAIDAATTGGAASAAHIAPRSAAIDRVPASALSRTIDGTRRRGSARHVRTRPSARALDGAGPRSAGEQIPTRRCARAVNVAAGRCATVDQAAAALSIAVTPDLTRHSRRAGEGTLAGIDHLARAPRAPRVADGGARRPVLRRGVLRRGVLRRGVLRRHVSRRVRWGHGPIGSRTVRRLTARRIRGALRVKRRSAAAPSRVSRHATGSRRSDVDRGASIRVEGRAAIVANSAAGQRTQDAESRQSAQPTHAKHFPCDAKHFS